MANIKTVSAGFNPNLNETSGSQRHGSLEDRERNEKVRVS